MNKLLFLACLCLLFSCKKDAAPNGKKGGDNNGTQKVFKVTVLDRESDIAVLTWGRPTNMDSSDVITYRIIVGKDTILYNNASLPYSLIGLDTTVYRGRVLATNAKGVTAIDTFYVESFSGSYYALDYNDTRFRKIGIGYAAPVAWEFYAYGDRFSGFRLPAFNGDTIFTSWGNGSLRATNTKTGAAYWETISGEDTGIGSLDRPGTLFLTRGSSGLAQHLLAASSKTGATKWDFVINNSFEQIISDPVISKNTVFVTTNLTLYAVDALTGVQKWRYDNPNPAGSFCRPSTDGTSVYVPSQQPALFCINAENGSLTWQSVASSFTNIGDFVNAHNGVVIQRLIDKTLAYDAQTGTVLYQLPKSTLPAFKADTVFIGYDSQVHALNIKTGAVIWKSSLPDYDLTGEMMVIGNTVFAGRGGSSESVLYSGSGRNSYRLKTSNGAAHPLNGTPAPSYDRVQVLPIITIRGKIYYDNSTGMGRSF